MYIRKISSMLNRKRYYWLVFATLVLIVIVAVLLASHASHTSSERKPGIYLEGPVKNIKLNTKYTYTFDVINSNKSYSQVWFAYVVPSSSIVEYIPVSKLTPNEDLKETVPITYGTSDNLNGDDFSNGAITVGVGYGPNKLRGTALFRDSFGVTLAPGQICSYSLGSGTGTDACNSGN
jgi:hypothetical protein